MKKLTISLLTSSVLFATSAFAVDVDEVINGYFDNTGGKEAWAQLKGVKMHAEVNQGGMKIPLEIVQLKDGRTYTKITFQGKEIMQGVYDGSETWSTNFMTMKAEKVASEEAANMALNANDFPDALFNYANKNYTLEYVGDETVDGAETHKLKLTKEPHTIDGKKVDDISYYYFETESMVPLAVETEIKSGEAKGAVMQITSGDYQEVDGLYFPFSLSQGVKGGQAQAITFTKIELNPTVDDSAFDFPVQTEETPAAANE